MGKNKEIKTLTLPTTNQLIKELEREKYKLKYNKLFKNTLSILIIVVAISVLISTLLFPVLQIYGKSMEPTLVKDDIVVSVKKSSFESGEVIAFYYNNRILVKRIIATSGDWVKIDEDGNVYVNDKMLIEDYVENKSLGENDITYPYYVEEGTYFVLGDERESSIDSRNSSIGTIEEEEIIGKVILKIWPIKSFGIVK